MAKILITGSTGYVGSRLIQSLGKSQHSLVCTARNPQFIEKRMPENAVAVKADFNQDTSFKSLFQGCEIAFFLMHSLGEKKEFERIELKVATNFAIGAKAARVKKIIYLGGLINQEENDQTCHFQFPLSPYRSFVCFFESVFSGLQQQVVKMCSKTNRGTN